MSQEGDQGVSQSGFTLQDEGTMSPHNGKRCRDQSEEGRHSTALGMDAQCIKAMDLNLSSDTVSSDCGGNGREDQASFLNNLAFSQSEKRIKCGPSNVDSKSQTPISSSLTANVGVVASDGGNNVSIGMTSQNLFQDCAAAIAKVSDKVVAEVHTVGIEKGSQFYCDICSVKSTSAKDWETHLAGKRHAKAKELVSGMGTSRISESSRGGSKAKVSTSQKLPASIENGSADLNSNMHTTSIGQQFLVDGSGEASKGYISGCIGGTNVDEVNFQASLSKCPDSSDANAVAVGQHASTIDCPFRETLVNQVLKNDPSSNVACNDGHNKYSCQPGTNGTFHNPTLADGLLEKISSRIISEGEPYKHLMASLSTKSNSDCVARALASALSTYGCPGLGELRKGSSCDQAACSDSQLEGAMSADSNGMVTMHARCFSNLLHEVRVSVMEDLILYGDLKTNTCSPSAAPVSASALHGEDLNCNLCRVEYGSKADLDLHLAGRKHASLVQRVYSRCQLCNLNCNTERDFKTHLSGKKHASKLRLVQKRVTF